MCANAYTSTVQRSRDILSFIGCGMLRMLRYRLKTLLSKKTKALRRLRSAPILYLILFLFVSAIQQCVSLQTDFWLESKKNNIILNGHFFYEFLDWIGLGNIRGDCVLHDTCSEWTREFQFIKQSN